jgi:hypothetical protein
MKEGVPLPTPAPEITPSYEGFSPIASGTKDGQNHSILPIDYEFLSSIPMPDVPLGPERKVDPLKKFIALHEAGHAITAFFLNVYVDEFTVIPNYSKESAGLTTLIYSPSDRYKLPIIAAAGSWYSPLGNGSDMELINDHHSKGGLSPSEALEAAKEYCKALTREEWSILSEIAAYKLTVKGHEIPDLIKRAKLEAKYLASKGIDTTLTNDEEAYINNLRTKITSVHEKTLNAPDMIRTTEETIYEEQEDGTIKKYKKKNGIITDVEFYCKECGLKEGHDGTCPTNKGKDKKALPFPKSATIFDEKEAA